MSSEDYLNRHSLDRIFKDMLTCLLEEHPEDPLNYMIEGLGRIRRAREIACANFTPQPTSFIHFFMSHSDSNEESDITELADKIMFEKTTNKTLMSGEELDLEGLEALSRQLQLDNPTDCILPNDFQKARRQSIRSESYQPNLTRRESIVIPKSAESRERIWAAVKNSFLFKNLDDDQRNSILDAMFERNVIEGEVVITEGEEGDNFYVIEYGQFSITKGGEHVDTIGPGKAFGELALMYNCPRSATVVAQGPGTLWAVNRKTFRQMVIDIAYQKRKLYEGFLKSVPLLSSLTSIEVSKIADALEPVSFEMGQNVVTEGEVGEEFYIIVSGQAQVTDKDGLVLNNLKEGDYFGELALLNETPRSASVIALSKLECICLTESAFKRLLGPLMDILKRNQELYKLSA